MNIESLILAIGKNLDSITRYEHYDKKEYFIVQADVKLNQSDRVALRVERDNLLEALTELYVQVVHTKELDVIETVV